MPLLTVIAALLALLVLVVVWNRMAVARWAGQPQPPGKRVNVGGAAWYVTVKGTGAPAVVIETALTGLSPEWWALQEVLAQHTTVVTYDRAGYGWSAAPTTPRTSANIAQEARALLAALNLPAPFVLVGHSQGGLYAQHFARLYPQDTAGVVLLDPLSPDDNRFKAELPPELYQGSGADKSMNLKIGAVMSRLGLLGLLKPLLLKSPPFFYFRDMPRERIELIWRHMLRPELYSTALDENTQAHLPENSAALHAAGAFPAVPLKILYHDGEVNISEMMQYGGLTREQAQQLETFWENLLRELLSLSPQSEWVPCPTSGHFIQHSRPDLVRAAVLAVVAQKQ
ncbi:MAG: alpha/beta hydrolase [Chloroflexi bacterium]|nr:alpha/beta hydrolase [Chloroflexota bacterium]